MKSQTLAPLLETPVSTLLRRRFRMGRHAGWWLLLAFGLAVLLGASSLPLSDVDEGAFTEATREMLAAGNLVSPTLNGLPRHDKPILIYWAQAASVAVLGEHELGFRLPSIGAALLWVLATGAFCGRFGRRADVPVVMLVMTLSLMVGVIAKAAIADALLNLWLALAMFGIFAYGEAARVNDPAAARRALRATAVALGLGFLTKGPVALMFPVVVGLLHLATMRQWRALRAALFDLPAWLLLLAIILPWHVMVYFDQGDAFFRGFYLQHNVNRYTSTFEGHGGNPLYYLLVMPLMLLPFAGWALFSLRRGWLRARQAPGRTDDVRLVRFMLLWFAVVFLFFSLSRTQLPHYLLYGATPLFLLMARYRPWRRAPWSMRAPAVAGMCLIAGLPWLLPEAVRWLTKADDLALLTALAGSFTPTVKSLLAALAILALGVSLLRRWPGWQVLLLVGLLQALAINGLLAPAVMAVTQGPVKALAEIARDIQVPVVSYRVSQPSFSVYRQAITPARLPLPGEVVFTRRDRLPELESRLKPAGLTMVSEHGRFLLAEVGLPR